MNTIRANFRDRVVEWRMNPWEARDIARWMEEELHEGDLALEDVKDLRAAANELDGKTTMSRLDLAGEQELRLNKLLDKMQKWLFQQPEWLDLMALDRGTRRRTADLVAKELLKLPVRTVDYPVNRAMRRVIAAEIKAKGGKA